MRIKSTILKNSALSIVMMFLGAGSISAQLSGGWDASQQYGASGINDWGNGVVQLQTATFGQTAAAILETTNPYDPNSGTVFSQCYQVFFACPGGDGVGSDSKGDGAAFSFYKSTSTYNIANGSPFGVLSTAGGLGYMGAVGDPLNPATKMITVEFDTYSSFGGANFDNAYGGGNAGSINDEISVHKQGDASDLGLMPGTTGNVGNLEDGKEHTICITYTPATTVLLVTIDGVTRLNYNMGANSLQNYFGAGGLNIAWSSAKFGASSPITVSKGASISDNAGAVIGLPNPSVADHTICQGDPFPNFSVVTVSGGPFTSIQWSVMGSGTAATTASTGAGNHIVEVTNAAGCSAKDTGVLTVTPLPVVNVADKAICQGSTTTFDAGTNVGATFAWTGPGGFNSTSQTPTVSVGGLYTITVTKNGCSASDNATLTVNALPVVAVADKTICAGATTTFDALNPGATFAWTGPGGFISAAQNPTVSAAGIYTVTVTKNTCVGTDNATLTLTPLPVVNVPDQSICDGNAIFDAGNAGATYAWTGPGGFNSTIRNPSVSVAGIYTVIVTANSCSASDNATLALAGTLTVAVADQTICSGTTTTFDAGNAGATFLWSGPGGFNSTSQTPTVTAAGPYSVTVTMGSCSATDNATLTLTALPVVNIADKAICTGSTTTFDALNAGATFSWTGPNFTSTAQTPTVSAGGTYSVTVTVGTCSATDDALLTLNPLPVVSVADQLICTGGSTTFDAGNTGATFSWTGPSGFISTSQTPTVSLGGTYIVTVTDGNSCSATDNALLTETAGPTVVVNDKSICTGSMTTFDAGNAGATFSWTGPGFTSTSQTPTVSAGGTYTVIVTVGTCSATDNAILTENALPVVDLGADKSICPGSTTTLDAGSGFTYFWNNSSTGQTLVVTTAGLYSVVITDGNGCQASDDVNVVVSTNLTVDLGPDKVICQGDPAVTFDAGNPGATYLWNDLSAARTFVTAITGPYSVTVTDGNGCSGTDNVLLTVNALPTPVVADQSKCSGASATFNAGNYSAYSWIGPNGFTSTANPITVSADGTYTVTVTDANGCKASDPAVLTINANPVVDLGSDYTGCSGTTAVFDAQNIGATYVWSNVASTQSISVTADGNYSVIVTDANGCIGTDAVTATFIAVPQLTIGADVDLCAGESKMVNATVTPNTSLVGWSTLEVGLNISVDSAGLIIAVATNGGNCFATDTLEVFVHDQPKVFGIRDSTVCFVNLPNGFMIDAGTIAAQYNWSDGQSGQVISVRSDGDYNVEMISDFGCVSRDTVTITEDCPSSIFAPTAFTPNEDGYNDVFYVRGENIYDFELFVFDRWGEVIFHSTDMNDGWNGRKYNDMRNAQIDVYVWKIYYRHWSDWKHDGNMRQEVGRVTLIK